MEYLANAILDMASLLKLSLTGVANAEGNFTALDVTSLTESISSIAENMAAFFVLLVAEILTVRTRAGPMMAFML